MVPFARIAFGSCNAVHNLWCHDLTKECNYLPQPMWPHIIQRQPDVWIWLGDAVYGDYPESFSQLNGDFTPASPERIREMYRRQKASTGYNKFLDTNVTVLGVWDDHDYGVNNGDFSYEHKVESKAAFREFIGGSWPNDAQYTSHRFNLGGLDAHVILLDVRYYRRPYGESDGDYLGEDQWTWFEQKVREKADLVIVGSGIQVMPLHRASKDAEGWENFPHAQQRIMSILASLNTTYVPVIISGDVHFAEMWELSCVIEATSSGLTHSWDDMGYFLGRDSNILWQEVFAYFGTTFLRTGQNALFKFGGPNGIFQTPQKNFGEISVESDGEVAVSLRGLNGLFWKTVIPKKTADTKCNFPTPLPRWRVGLNWAMIYTYVLGPPITMGSLIVALIIAIPLRQKRRKWAAKKDN